MVSAWRSICQLAVASIFAFNLLDGASADVNYCSDLNTASTPKNSSIYQSNGLCNDFCRPNYAFAVVQDDGCWCSDYAPGKTTTGCTLDCRGFPSEKCGGIGVFGYIQLLRKPSGTKGASSSTTTTTEQEETSTTSTRATTTTTVNLPSASVSTQTSSRSFLSSTSSTTEVKSTSQTTTRRSTSTWFPTPVVSLETVTGQVRTVTFTPTQPPDSQNSNLLPKSTSKGGLSTGAAVGLTIGLVALAALVFGIIFFWLRKKRQQQKDDGYVDNSQDSITDAGGPIPSRSMSENSRYVLGTDGRQVVETWVPNENSEQRKSRLVPVDPRLDPFSPVYQRNGDSKSRESVNTIRDDHDYSRRVHHNAPILRATNPD